MLSILRNFFDIRRSPTLKFLAKPFKRKEKLETKSPEPTLIIQLPELDSRVIDACKILVIGWDSKDQENLGGEYKRHQVYSKLIKLYPQHDRKKLALLIELVINELV